MRRKTLSAKPVGVTNTATSLFFALLTKEDRFAAVATASLFRRTPISGGPPPHGCEMTAPYAAVDGERVKL
jgi:hypothetical protein